MEADWTLRDEEKRRENVDNYHRYKMTSDREQQTTADPCRYMTQPIKVVDSHAGAILIMYILTTTNWDLHPKIYAQTTAEEFRQTTYEDQ